MSHKDKMRIVKKESKVRKTWGTLKPTTRVINSEKKYNRNRAKHEARKEAQFSCDW